MPRYKEKVIKPFAAHGKQYMAGDTYREVSISERDAKLLNARKNDLGFEYLLIDPLQYEKAEQKTVDAENPVHRFNKKK